MCPPVIWVSLKFDQLNFKSPADLAALIWVPQTQSRYNRMYSYRLSRMGPFALGLFENLIWGGHIKIVMMAVRACHRQASPVGTLDGVEICN